MITLTREEAQQVLDALLDSTPTGWMGYGRGLSYKAIETLRARLSAPEPKPTRSEKMRDAGVTRRPKGWSKDGDEPSVEPVAWCACRWDSEDKRIATCERHQGWLDVIAEWADRAREAEQKLRIKNMDRQCPSCGGFCKKSGCERENIAPPQREWQGLTDEEIGELERHYLFGGIEFGDDIGYWAVYRAVESKLREKNA